MSETRKLRVFLCHSSQDKSIVRELYQRLNAEGWIDPWLDEEKLLPGQDWDMEIEKAVENAHAVIVFLSNGSVTKEGYVQRELRKVLDVSDEKPEGTLFVIPIRMDDVQIPRRLKMWQYVDFFPANVKASSWIRLIASLRRRAESIAPPTVSFPAVSLLAVEDEDIAIHVRVLGEMGKAKVDFYFISNPKITVYELMRNIKRDYPDELPNALDDYKIDFQLFLDDSIDRLAVGNDSLLTISLQSQLYN